MGSVSRFVVLQHDHPKVHWDFMLERGGVLRTWALARPPDESGQIEARPLPDHRLQYLHYEGPISRDRGTVVQWDGGIYQVVEETESTVRVRLHGTRLQGQAELAAKGGGQGWVFRWIEG